MRLGILTTHSPVPANRGPRIRLASIITALREQHEVDLILLSDEREDHIDALRADGLTVERLAFRAWDALPSRDRIRFNAAAILRGTTPAFESVDGAATRAAIERVAARVGLMIVDTTSLAPYATWLRRRHPTLPLIINTHDVDSELFARLAAKQRFVRRWHKLVLAANAKRVERSFSDSADAVLAVSERDRKRLADLNGGRLRVYVVENAVDTDSLKALPAVSTPTLIFCGVLNYQPNVEGLTWFVRSVLPRVRKDVPRVRLLLVGRTPADELRSLTNDPSIELVADVVDVRPSYARSAVAIVPLLTGGGTRLKILEALALGRAVVSTSLGAEGIEECRGLVRADGAEEFALAVTRMLCDPEREMLVRESLPMIEARYSWHAVGARLRRITDDVVQTRSR